MLLATALSFATTVGWWAVSSWLPAYTEALAKAAGEPAGVWGPRMGVIYNIGAIMRLSHLRLPCGLRSAGGSSCS